MSETEVPAEGQGERCSVCGGTVPPHGNYCPNCGSLKPSLAGRRDVPSDLLPAAYARRYHYSRSRTVSWRRIARTGSAVVMLSFAVYLFVMLVTLVHGVSIVMPEIGAHSFVLQIALVWLVPLVTISGAMLEAWYLVLVAAIVVSAVWVLVRSAPRYLAEVTGKGKARDHSPFYDLCGLMFAVYFVNAVIVLFMLLAGYDPSTPSEGSEEWELLFLLANASVWEELIVRVLMVGVPLLAIGALGKNRAHKPSRYLLGGGIEIRWVEASVILASAAVFGMAHYWGWGLWKVFPSTLAGVAFGYIFLRHGLAASILLHFSFDYLSLPITVFDPSLGAQFAFALAALAWLGLGAVFAIYYSTRMLEFVLGRRLLEDPADVAVGAAGGYPLGYGTPGTASSPTWTSAGDAPGEAVRSGGARPPSGGGWFTCPVCGSGEARWFDGKLQCLRCGRMFQ